MATDELTERAAHPVGVEAVGAPVILGRAVPTQLDGGHAEAQHPVRAIRRRRADLDARGAREMVLDQDGAAHRSDRTPRV